MKLTGNIRTSGFRVMTSIVQGEKGGYLPISRLTFGSTAIMALTDVYYQ